MKIRGDSERGKLEEEDDPTSLRTLLDRNVDSALLQLSPSVS